MPIYAYRCAACGHAKDVLQKLSDPQLTTCPACGAEAFQKQVTAAGFQLKGSGWYVTDFKGDGKAAKKPAEGDAAAAKPDAAAGDAAKGDAAKGDAAKPDAPKPEAPKPEAAKSESPAASPSAPAAPASGSA